MLSYSFIIIRTIYDILFEQYTRTINIELLSLFIHNINQNSIRIELFNEYSIIVHDAITVPYGGVPIVRDKQKPMNTATISLIYANQRFREEELRTLGDTPSASPRRDPCAER